MKRLMFESIRTRLTFWFLILTLIPLVIVLFITYFQRVNFIESRTFDKLTAIRDLKVERLKDWIGERTNDLDVLSSNFGGGKLENIINKDHFDQNDMYVLEIMRELLIRFLKNHSVYSELLIINPRTGIIEISTNPDYEGMNKSNDLYFTESMQTRELFIKDIYYSNTTQKNVMTFSIPIFCSNHDPAHITGILVAHVDLENSLYKLLSNRVGLGKTGETLIVNKDVVALNELRWDHNATLNRQITAEPAVNAAHGETGITVTTDYRGKDILAAYTYIPETRWGFVCKQDIYELNAPIREMIRNFIILFVIISIVIFIISLYVSKSISKPVIDLNIAAQKIRSGNYEIRTFVSSGDEISQLADSFNKMALQLKETYESLEVKVSDRTKDLKKANKELNKLKHNLEKTVIDRTRDLEKKVLELDRSEKAMLYMVEDLNQTSEQLKTEQEKLGAANKELEAFSYSVSHDLRAPLRAIDGFTRILMEDYVANLDSEGKRLGSVIQHNAKKMGQLIDDLLVFSRSARTPMKISEIDMKNMANAMYHEATIQEDRQRINFTIGDLPVAEGDTTMMRQVWMNLISNAVKFSANRKQALISVSCKEKENKLTYCIKDNGAGFDMKYKDKLFGVFQRLHSEKEFEGTGVGLALVQRIINRHGGEVQAEGEVDKGATFYFSLPKID